MTLRTDRQIYSKPPIVEAVIDIRTVNRDVRIRDLDRLGASLEGYGDREELVEVLQTFKPDESTETARRPFGIAYRSSSRGTIVQLQTTGFACSKLAPYDRWESFRDHARETWFRYVQVARPVSLMRVAVRFINRIEVGGPLRDFAPFVNVYPRTPWDLAAPPSGVFMQIRQRISRGGVLVLNESVVQNDRSENAILLDLDAFYERETTFDHDLVWNEIEELHAVVDETFENSITELVRELIR